jgi:hypothetical protein
VSTVRRPTTRRPTVVEVEFDTFRVAVGLALITGGLALALPYLDGLTGALAALAVAGWAAGRGRDRVPGTFGIRPGQIVGLGLAAMGAGAFFLLPGALSFARGLALALSLVPMWWMERGRPSSGPTLRVDGAL